jgi:hypothetical protein
MARNRNKTRIRYYAIATIWRDVGFEFDGSISYARIFQHRLPSKSIRRAREKIAPKLQKRFTHLVQSDKDHLVVEVALLNAHHKGS